MLEYINENYWKQTLNVESIQIDRLLFFINRFKGKKILHIGCVDGDIFNIDKKSNLHINLINAGLDIDGLDIRTDLIFEMKKEFPNNVFYSSIKEINKKYDIVLVPEVLEHVENTRLFLDDIFTIDSEYFFITVPNCEGLKANFISNGNIAIELIHPDHYYWFSAYTLFNITKKYINNMYNVNMFYLQNKSSVAIEIKK